MQAALGGMEMALRDQWVFEDLLEQEKLEHDVLMKHFCEKLTCAVTDLPPHIQFRLMLRVLRNTSGAPDENTLNALNCLVAFSTPQDSVQVQLAPGMSIKHLEPDPQLFLLARTELALQPLRNAIQSGDFTAPAVDEFKAALNKFLPAGDVEDIAARHRELAAGEDPSQAALLLERFPVHQVSALMNQYVDRARTALGPTVLQIVEADFVQGRYYPGTVPAMAGAPQDVSAKKKRKPRRSGEDLIDELGQQRKQLRAAGGADPLTAGMAADFSQSFQQQPTPTKAVQAAADGGEQGLMLGQGQGRTVQWNDGQDFGLTPEQMAAGEVVGYGEHPGVKKSPTGNARRRVGRWTQDETNKLIELVRQYGKGKWKKILENGTGHFQNRTQVDLKDKWRNLVRQGVVADLVSDHAAPGMQDDGSGAGGALLNAVAQHEPHADPAQMHHHQQLQQQQGGMMGEGPGGGLMGDAGGGMPEQQQGLDQQHHQQAAMAAQVPVQGLPGVPQHSQEMPQALPTGPPQGVQLQEQVYQQPATQLPGTQEGELLGL